jgi:hypothetical protein
MFYLEELAEGYAGDGGYEFFFLVPPPPIPGCSCYPVNPIAIK